MLRIIILKSIPLCVLLIIFGLRLLWQPSFRAHILVFYKNYGIFFLKTWNKFVRIYRNFGETRKTLYLRKCRRIFKLIIYKTRRKFQKNCYYFLSTTFYKIYEKIFFIIFRKIGEILNILSIFSRNNEVFLRRFLVNVEDILRNFWKKLKNFGEIQGNLEDVSYENFEEFWNVDEIYENTFWKHIAKNFSRNNAKLTLSNRWRNSLDI